MTKTTPEVGQRHYPYPEAWEGTVDGMQAFDPSSLRTLLEEDGWSVVLNKLYGFWWCVLSCVRTAFALPYMHAHLAWVGDSPFILVFVKG